MRINPVSNQKNTSKNNQKSNKSSIKTTINIICTKSASCELFDQVYDLLKEQNILKKISVDLFRSNVIQVVCKDEAKYWKGLDLLNGEDSFVKECFVSPAIFTHTSMTLSHSTPSEYFHLKMLKNIFERGRNSIVELYTNYSQNKQFNIRVSIKDKNSFIEMANIPGLQLSKSIEQIRNETKENTSQCSIPSKVSDEEIRKAVERAFTRIGKPFNEAKLTITKSGNGRYKLAKVEHANREEMQQFIKKAMCISGSLHYSKSSIEVLDEKIERKRKLHPYLPIIDINPKVDESEPAKNQDSDVTRLENTLKEIVESYNQKIQLLTKALDLMSDAFVLLSGNKNSNNTKN